MPVSTWLVRAPVPCSALKHACIIPQHSASECIPQMIGQDTIRQSAHSIWHTAFSISWSEGMGYGMQLAYHLTIGSVDHAAPMHATNTSLTAEHATPMHATTAGRAPVAVQLLSAPNGPWEPDPHSTCKLLRCVLSHLRHTYRDEHSDPRLHPRLCLAPASQIPFASQAVPAATAQQYAMSPGVLAPCIVSAAVRGAGGRRKAFDS